MVQATYWAPQPKNVTPGRWISLADWRVAGTNRRAVRNLHCAQKENKQTCLLSKQCRKSRLNCTRFWPVSHNHSSAQPSLSQGPTTHCLISDTAPHWSEGCHGRRECSASEWDRGSNYWLTEAVCASEAIPEPDCIWGCHSPGPGPH